MVTGENFGLFVDNGNLIESSFRFSVFHGDLLIESQEILNFYRKNCFR